MRYTNSGAVEHWYIEDGKVVRKEKNMPDHYELEDGYWQSLERLRNDYYNMILILQDKIDAMLDKRKYYPCNKVADLDEKIENNRAEWYQLCRDADMYIMSSGLHKAGVALAALKQDNTYIKNIEEMRIIV